MGMGFSVQGGDTDRVYETEVAAQKGVAATEAANQVQTESDAQTEESETVNPFGAKIEQKKEATRSGMSERVQKMLETGGPVLMPVEEIAEGFERERENPELKAGALIALRDQIKEGDSKEKIINTVMTFYKDALLALEALDFLLLSTSGPLKETVQAAKEAFIDTHQRELRAGRNIQQQVEEANKQGLGEPPSSLRKSYQDYTSKELDSVSLFQDLQKKYSSYEDIKVMLQFLLHSLGSDLKPPLGADLKPLPSSITTNDRPKMQNLINETKICQSILHNYNFFNARMSVIKLLFEKDHMEKPAQLTFESIAKEYMNLVSNRTFDRNSVLSLAPKLGISVDKLGAQNALRAQIAVFSQMLAASYNVSLRIFKTGTIRDDALERRNKCIQNLEDVLEQLEGQLEDLIDVQVDEED
jgi:hypothetical protein